MRGYQPGLSLVLAIGLLGGSVGVVAAQDAEPPIEFTGRLSFGPQVGTGTFLRIEPGDPPADTRIDQAP